ncbi:histidine kinase, partial [Rhizobium sp. Pop5]
MKIKSLAFGLAFFSVFGCGLSQHRRCPKISVMNCRYQAEFNMKTNESTPRGHLQDETSWTTSLLARIRRERPVLLAAILSALVALAAGMNKWAVLILLLAMVLTALFNEAPVIEAEAAEPVEIEPEARPSRLAEVSATLSGLDIPVMVLSDDASVLFQNRAAEKAFGEVTLGAHISARLRSPGVLDMVRETIATNAPNQI